MLRKVSVAVVLFLFASGFVVNASGGREIAVGIGFADYIFPSAQDGKVRAFATDMVFTDQPSEFVYQTRNGSIVTRKIYYLHSRTITTETWDISGSHIRLTGLQQQVYLDDKPVIAEVEFPDNGLIHNMSMTFMGIGDQTGRPVYAEEERVISLEESYFHNEQGDVQSGIVIETAGSYRGPEFDWESVAMESFYQYILGLGLVYSSNIDEDGWGRSIRYQDSMSLGEFMEIWTGRRDPGGKRESGDADLIRVYIPAKWNDWSTVDEMTQVSENLYSFRKWFLPDRTYEFRFWDGSWQSTYNLTVSPDNHAADIITGFPGYAYGNIPLKVPVAGYYRILYQREEGIYWIEGPLTRNSPQ